jgi:HAMP domain-containing protein
MNPHTAKQEVHRYLLGDLPEEEELALERDYFVDDQMLEQVWEVENELADRYVRGELERDEKSLFERNYLASPVHRERVAFAKMLVESIDSQAQRPRSAVPPSMSWWRAFSASLKGNSLRWATVAVLIALVGISVVLLNARVRLTRQIDQLKTESSSQQQRAEQLETEIAAERDESDRLAGEIARMKEESQPEERAFQTSTGAARSVLSFVLSPTLTRSGGDTQHLSLSKETAAVLLQMKVQQPVAQVFQIDLRTVDGVTVWSKASIKARQNKDSITVSATVPARKLEAGDYILTLSATNGASESEEINRYFFRVSRQ